MMGACEREALLLLLMAADGFKASSPVAGP